MANASQDQHLKSSPQSRILFYKGHFGKEHSKPPGKYLWQELFKSTPKPSFFFWPSSVFFKIWDWDLSAPSKKTGRLWYCGDWFNKITKNLSRSCQMCIWRLLIIVEFVDGGVVLGLPPSFSVVRLRSWWFSHKDELIYFDISSSSQQRICESLLFDDKIK